MVQRTDAKTCLFGVALTHSLAPAFKCSLAGHLFHDETCSFETSSKRVHIHRPTSYASPIPVEHPPTQSLRQRLFLTLRNVSLSRPCVTSPSSSSRASLTPYRTPVWPSSNAPRDAARLRSYGRARRPSRLRYAPRNLCPRHASPTRRGCARHRSSPGNSPGQPRRSSRHARLCTARKPPQHQL